MNNTQVFTWAQIHVGLILPLTAIYQMLVNLYLCCFWFCQQSCWAGKAKVSPLPSYWLQSLEIG